VHGTPGGDAIAIDVPPDLASIDGVRAQIEAAASRWGVGEIDPLALVTSELVTNAIVHAGTESVITCRLLAPDEVELAVTDHGAGTPRMGDPDVDDTGGRGLRIVDALSTTWGVRHLAPDETTVWARVNVAPAPPDRRP